MRSILAGLAIAVLFTTALAPAHAQPRKGAATGAEITGLKIADPQPKTVEPGLGVTYNYGLINNVDEMKDADGGEAGPPLPHLNYDMGFKTVLTSKRDDGVQARITGFIKFDAAGSYKFAVKSNDGVRLWIGDKKIYELPGVHSDTMSDIFAVKVEKAGWYPIKILYFEKKETATLQVYWAAPGKDDMEPIPGSALGYVKK